jgi:hypothetical protein
MDYFLAPSRLHGTPRFFFLLVALPQPHYQTFYELWPLSIFQIPWLGVIFHISKKTAILRPTDTEKRGKGEGVLMKRTQRKSVAKQSILKPEAKKVRSSRKSDSKQELDDGISTHPLKSRVDTKRIVDMTEEERIAMTCQLLNVMQTTLSQIILLGQMKCNPEVLERFGKELKLLQEKYKGL